jgi:hypothetical protein
MKNERNVLEKVKYISIDEAIPTELEIESTPLNIKIGSKDFIVYVSDKEVDQEFSKLVDIADAQNGMIYSIIALRKLAKFLQMALDIGFTKDILE